MHNDPMIEKYRRELLEFSRRHPKFGGAKPQPQPQPQPQPETRTDTQVEVQVQVRDETPAQRIVPAENLYRADFAQDTEAVTTAARLQNVAQREQAPDLPDAVPPRAAAAAQNTPEPVQNTPAPVQNTPVPMHSDPNEMEYAACDSSDPPYCNGAVETFPTREAFLAANPESGFLRVQVSVAEQAYPVQNASVEISKTFSGQKYVFFSAQTDASGIISRVTLPAPDRDLSSAPSALQPYATYDIFISHPDFTDVYVPNCIVFATIETIQQVRMVPNETCAENPGQPFCEEE